MFDTFIKSGGYKHVDVDAEVHIHRAPTDKSVALLREMEQAAEKNLISRTKLENNLFDATVFVFEDRYNMDGVRVIVKYAINGVEKEKEISMCRTNLLMNHNTPGGPGAEAMRTIYKEISEDIAMTLMMNLYKDQENMQRMREGLRLGRNNLH